MSSRAPIHLKPSRLMPDPDVDALAAECVQAQLPHHSMRIGSSQKSRLAESCIRRSAFKSQNLALCEAEYLQSQASEGQLSSRGGKVT